MRAVSARISSRVFEDEWTRIRELEFLVGRLEERRRIVDLVVGGQPQEGVIDAGIGILAGQTERQVRMGPGLQGPLEQGPHQRLGGGLGLDQHPVPGAQRGGVLDQDRRQTFGSRVAHGNGAGIVSPGPASLFRGKRSIFPRWSETGAYAGPATV